MTIALMLEVDGKPPRWSRQDAAKLEAALEVLQRRFGLDIDRPTERHDIRHAVGALWSVLAAASDDPKYTEEHPAEVDREDLPL